MSSLNASTILRITAMETASGVMELIDSKE
jgi:hypothetical protein